MKTVLQERNTILDVSKGIGILFVILGHLITYGSFFSCIIFSFHMPLFFFLSGLVFNYDNSRSTFFYKIKNLLFPYFFWLFFGFSICLVIPGWKNFTIKTILYHVIYNTQPECFHVGQIWFLFCLIIVICLFYIFQFLIKRDLSKLLFSFFIFFVIWFMKKLNVTIHFRNEYLRMPFKIDTALACLNFFYCGYYCKLKRVVNKIQNLNTFFIISLILISALIVIFVAYVNKMVNVCDNIYNNPILFLIGAYFGIFGIILISILLSKYKKIKVLSYIGKNSLPIFCMHSMFLELYSFVISRVFKQDIRFMNMSITLGIIGLIFVTFFSLFVPLVYNITVGKLIKKINPKIVKETL